MIAQLVIGKALEGNTATVIVGAHEHRQAAHEVAGRNDVAVLGHNEQRERSVNLRLGILDAGDQVILLVDERRHQLG